MRQKSLEIDTLVDCVFKEMCKSCLAALTFNIPESKD